MRKQQIASKWGFQCPKCGKLTMFIEQADDFKCEICGYRRPKQRCLIYKDIKAKQRAYRQRPDIKAKKRAYRQRPDIKAKQRAYRQRPDIKAKKRAYYLAYKDRKEDTWHT